jgi:zinc protease
MGLSSAGNTGARLQRPERRSTMHPKSAWLLFLAIWLTAASASAADYAVVVSQRTNDDPAWQKVVAALVDVFNDFRPELFLTSGHATDRDWQIGYPPQKKGEFRCKDGVLLGVDLKGKRFPINSPNPKVYLPSGNCPMGLIRDRQSMALAWMKSGGVDQMIVHELETRFPKTARSEFNEWNIETDPRLLGRLAASLGYTRPDDGMKDNLGLLWDRDTVALYGDPAWEARLAPRELPFTQNLAQKGDLYTFEIRATKDCTPGRPPAVLLPQRIKDVVLVEGKELAPLVADNFIIVTKPGNFAAGKTYRVAFRAKRAI